MSGFVAVFSGVFLRLNSNLLSIALMFCPCTFFWFNQVTLTVALALYLCLYAVHYS